MSAHVDVSQAIGARACRVGSVDARAYTIPTEQPESDGTLAWTSTTLVSVHVDSDGHTGFGYTYTAPAAAAFVRDTLAPHLEGQVFASPMQAHDLLRRQIRNFGVVGVAACALSAVDIALWDLFSRSRGVSVADLMGAARTHVPAYGSGGFTSYSLPQLRDHMSAWAERGFLAAKMKVGRTPDKDVARVAAARSSIGDEIGLFVDANGGYEVRQALQMSERFADLGVSWFEEPRPADDVAGNREVRERAPAGLEITGGEYLWAPVEARAMIDQRCYDVIQPDVTRCGGFTGLLRIAALAEAARMPMSTHCAPALSARAALACPGVRIIEYFHDHGIIERRYLDGAEAPENGDMRPDPSTPGLGLALRRSDLEPSAAD